jgi:hypothetical protein
MSTAPDTRPPKNTSGKTNAQNVRPNQRKAYRKATRIEIEQRIEWLADFIAERPLVSRTEIHRVMRERYNVLYLNTDLIYVKRAREQLSKRVNMTKQEAKELGVNLLVRLAKSGKDQIKLAAEKRIGEIYGYNAPTHLRVGDPSGKPMAPMVVAPTVQFIMPANNRDRVVNSNGDSHLKTLTDSQLQPKESNGNGHQPDEDSTS